MGEAQVEHPLSERSKGGVASNWLATQEKEGSVGTKGYLPCEEGFFG